MNREAAERCTILRGLVGSTVHGLNVNDGIEDRDEMGVCVEPMQDALALWSLVIVDEEFARRHSRNEEPIGKQVRMPWGPLPAQQVVLTVVGVVTHVTRTTQRAKRVRASISARPADQPGVS